MRQAFIFCVLCCTVVQFPAYAGDYSYDVSGYSSSGEYVSGELETNRGSRDVEGTLTLENGEQVQFEGEWTGRGTVEGTDENGESYEIEVD